MSKKATHIGECQVCGHRQKLPNGKLSLHGYSVNAGFFEGTCNGAKHLPFEQDKSLIDGSIRMAKEQLARIEANIAAQLDGSGQLVIEVYDRYARHQSLSRRQVDVIEVLENGSISYIQPTTKEVATTNGYGFGKANVTKQLRDRKIWKLEQTAKQIKHYIGWQENRIQDWKVQLLQPIEP